MDCIPPWRCPERPGVAGSLSDFAHDVAVGQLLVHGTGRENFSVEAITFVENPVLRERFQRVMEAERGRHAAPILVSHGTASRPEDICKSGFDPKYIGLRDPGFFGRGFYFSQMGNGYAHHWGHGQFLLCWILPGRVYTCTADDGQLALMDNTTTGAGKPIAEHFDSHLVFVHHTDLSLPVERVRATTDERVIFDPHRILPLCIVDYTVTKNYKTLFKK